MTSLTGDEMTWSWLKFLISWDFNIVGNVWDHASTQVIKIYNIVLVDFDILF